MGIAQTLHSMKSPWFAEIKYPGGHSFLVTIIASSKQSVAEQVKQKHPGAFIKDIYKA